MRSIISEGVFINTMQIHLLITEEFPCFADKTFIKKISIPMRRIGFSLIVILISSLVQGQHKAYADRIIKTLASEAFYGRGYVQNGSDLSAGFIEEEMKAMNLEIIAEHPFQIPVNTFPGNMQLTIDGQILKPGKDYLIDPSSPSANITTNDIRIISKNELLNKDSFHEVVASLVTDVAVVDVRSMDKSAVSEQLNILKFSQAALHKALLIFTDDKLTWGVSRVQLLRPVFTVKSVLKITEIGSVDIEIDALFHPRYPVRNVIGKINGHHSDSVIMFTAHYDHLGMMGNNTVFPGANDNASGIAMMLSIARYFQKNPIKYDMLFVAFGAEETGLVGSQYFVENSPIDLSKIRFLINFDLAGTGGEGITVVNAIKYPGTFKRLRSLNDSLQLLPDIKERGEACNSDHCPFDRQNVPCFYIYTRGGIQAYHDVFDRYETLPLTEFEDYATLMIELVKSFQ